MTIPTFSEWCSCTPASPPDTEDRALFNAVVAAAFSQRRKTLRNALAKLACETHFIRAEALSVEQYIALADAIAD